MAFISSLRYGKSEVQRCDLHPMLFQLYVSVGVFLSSWLVLPFMQFNGDLTDADGKNTPAFPFPWLGLIAGMIFVVSILFSFAAIPYIGLAMAQGVWGGSAILVAFIWGVAIFGNPVDSIGVAFAAIILLLTGVLGIAFCETIANKINEWRGKDSSYGGLDEKLDPLSGDPEIKMEGSNEGTHLTTEEGDKAMGNWLLGIIFALCVGLAGGSTLVPLNYVAKKESGLAFVPAFGCGAMIFSPLVAVLWFSYANNSKWPPLHLRETLWAGILSGALWNASNICAIISIPAITYSVAYPMLQCALFVAGLWGIFAFREIQGEAVYIFFASGAVLISGAICLALNAT
eukprot:jgi/Bigna1/66196/fgenesh1_pg.1_\